MTNMKLSAIKVCQTLSDHGFEAVFAGGCVRDMLMNRPFNDIDIATSATPDEVESVFKKTIAIGKQFGVINVLLDGFEFEVATFRIDGHSSDGRHPDDVEFSSMEEDAKRRDLTVNGLFWDPVRNVIHDFVGGQKDIEDKQLKFIGDANARIEEDKLRMMRLFRFAARFPDFGVDLAAIIAVTDNADKIVSVSAERIKAELDKMLKANMPTRAFHLMEASGMLKHILPELSALVGCEQSKRWHSEGDVWTHSMLAVENARKMSDKLEILWGALLHDIGKPATVGINKRGDICNHGHEFVGADMIDSIAERLRFSSNLKKEVKFLVKEHMRVRNVGKMKRFKVRRLVASEFIEDLIIVSRADNSAAIAEDPAMEVNKFEWLDILNRFEEEVGFGLPDPFINGDDLKSLGFKPGPNFKVILDKVQEQQLEDRILSRDDAVDFVLRRFKGMRDAAAV